MKKNRIAVVGAGIAGCVIAHELANHGFKVDVFEGRKHIGGNCYTEKNEFGIIEHKYGPHIFHTSQKYIWDYINNFVEMVPFVNRVKAVHKGNIYSMPINLHTINQFFNQNLNPKDAQKFIKSQGVNLSKIESFEEQALAFIGKDLYEAFFKNYTIKQWGVHPENLPASILKRLPVRFTYNDNYYNDGYQGIPRNGYTEFFEKLLDNKNINVFINNKVNHSDLLNYDHVFSSAPLDSWFDFKFGQLKYRTLDFVKEVHDGDYQGNPVINYVDSDVPFTRITEHQNFMEERVSDKTVIFKEYSRLAKKEDILYYPMRLQDDKERLKSYEDLALKTRGLTMIGRLGKYLYLDMDKSIEQALKDVNDFLKR